MNKVNTKTGNKLIAKFMGYEEGWFVPGEKKLKQFWNGDKVYYPNELKYHKSWDWLIPAAKKVGITVVDTNDIHTTFSDVVQRVKHCQMAVK